CDDKEGVARLAREQGLLSLAAPDVVPARPCSSRPVVSARLTRKALSAEEFARQYGDPDTARAIHSFTPPADTHVVLALLSHLKPLRVLEVGTAEGHMTANLTEWTPPEATVFTLGVTRDMAG